MKRKLLWGSVVAVVVLLCCGAGVFMEMSALLDQSRNQAKVNLAGCGSATTVSMNQNIHPAGGLTGEQTRNAAGIIQAGQQLKLPPRAWVIATATAMQESNLEDMANPSVPESMSLPHQGSGADHDSVGLFQQRPNWGSTAELMDPVASAKKFYAKLVQVPNWQTRSLTDVAQAVQVSAFPDAYAKWETDAVNAVNALTNGAARSAIGNAELTGNAPMKCATANQIAASGWTAPASGPITSGFRTPERPTHNGADIGAPMGAPIHAASSGLVTVAQCDPSTGNCDRSGDASTPGCGWYVEIKHAGNVITRYCHMHQRPLVTVGQQVQVGQQLGIVGDSGNAEGAHLHFEVHLNGDPSASGATDPVPFMQQKGAPLGKS